MRDNRCILRSYVLLLLIHYLSRIYYLLLLVYYLNLLFIFYMNYYEWVKRMKFLLAVIYIGRLDDIQIALKPLNISEKIEINLYGHFRIS